MKKLIAALTLIAPLCVPSIAQENIPEPSRKPLAAMEKLNALVGQWQVVSEFSADGGKTWQTSEPARAEFSFRQKGMMLAEIPLDTHLPGFHVETIFGYDQYRDVYRFIAIDDVWGIVDLYEGNIEDDRLIVTNLKSGTFFPIGSAQWRAFRITIDLTGDKRVMTVEKSDDNGNSWQQNFKIIYTKL